MNKNVICISDEEREKLNNIIAKGATNYIVPEKCKYCECFFNFICRADKCAVQ